MSFDMARWCKRGLLATVCIAGVAVAQQGAEHRGFASPEAAVDGLVAAVQADDLDALRQILGPDSDSLLDSGDPVQDRSDRIGFLEAYRTAHAIEVEDETRRTLVTGDNAWPFPVPLVLREGAWYLDGREGADEIVYRRIGENELGAIRVCRGVVEAQQEYAAQGRDGDPAGIYAFKLISDEGLHNGLYWPAAEGEPDSPAGPFIAAAAAEGYRRAAERQPYHGYFYRMLFRQGGLAPGGERDYFKDGLLTEGFALIAWPAEYDVSGIMTFMVNQDGTVYQRDLGEDTEALAGAIDSFDPGPEWTAVPEDVAQ